MQKKHYYPTQSNTAKQKPSRRIKRNKQQQTEKNNLTTSGSPTRPEEMSKEHFDCEVDEVSKKLHITKVKNYGINKISTCKFKPLDLEMERTGVQQKSSAKAVETKAFAVEATIEEKVHWCSEHTD